MTECIIPALIESDAMETRTLNLLNAYIAGIIPTDAILYSEFTEEIIDCNLADRDINRIIEKLDKDAIYSGKEREINRMIMIIDGSRPSR